jgi:SAM-dependent methyltransferase
MKARGGKGFWGRQKARWYSEGLRHSDYAEKVFDVIRPRILGCSTLLDVGAGCGALCIPLSEELDHVVALDSSAPMLDELRREARARGMSNIEAKQGSWDELHEELGLFDVVLVANVPGVLDDSNKSMARLERHARRVVFLVLGTPGNMDKFYFRELWPRIFGHDHPSKRDYFDAYGVLYRMGIYAGVEIVNYNFDQPFEDMDEAIAFWKDHMRLDGSEHDSVLREFLSERLEPSGGLLWARVPKQSAVIWWRPSDTQKRQPATSL